MSWLGAYFYENNGSDTPLLIKVFITKNNEFHIKFIDPVDKNEFKGYLVFNNGPTIHDVFLRQIKYDGTFKLS